MHTADIIPVDPSPRCATALEAIDRLVDAGLPVDRRSLLEAYAEVAGELLTHFDVVDRLDELRAANAAISNGHLEPQPIESFGDYEVLQELGRGGMAVVYLARQTSLDRLVALKFPIGGALAGAGAADRFRQEAVALAQLRHPHIVMIHEVGEHAGRTYLSMEYVEGTDLAKLLRDEPPSIRRAVELARSIAVAMHYAHEQGIVHRDLKPANVLLDRSGAVRVADFGLGKILAADPSLTQTGQILGTLRYMPPEHADGDSDRSPESGDIYALGAILYELLTGRAAFWANSTGALIRQIFEHDPLPLRQHDPAIPRDVETICLKCLSKNPSERYTTAGALADDLLRFLDGRPVCARPIGKLENLLRWCRRKPVVAGLSLLSFVTVIAASVVSTWFGIEANRERRAAVVAKERADKNAGAAEQLARRSQREIAMHEIQRMRLPPRRAEWSVQAQKLVSQAVEVEYDARLRDEYVACLTGMDAECTRFWEYRSSSAAFNEDGTQLLIGGGFGTNTRLWRAADDSWQETAHGGFGPVAFSSDGEGLQWTADSPWSFSLWNVSRQSRMNRVSVPAVEQILPPADDEQLQQLMARVCLCASRDMTLVAASTPSLDSGGEKEGQDETFVWNDRGELLLRIPEEASGLCFSPDNRILAVGRADGRIELHRLAGDEPVVTLQDGANRIHGIDFVANPLRRDGKAGFLLAAGDAGGVVTVWDVEQARLQSRCLGSAWNVYAVRFSPDGMTLAAGGRGARLYNFLTGQCLLELTGIGDYVTDLAFSRDATSLVVATRSPQADHRQATTVHSINYGRGIDILHGMSSQIAQTWLSADNRFLAVLGQNWEVGVYELQPPRLKYIVPGPVGDFADNAAVVISADNRLLAVSTGSEVRLWELESGAPVRTYQLPPGLVDQLAFTPDGRLLSFRWESADGRTPPYVVGQIEGAGRVLRLRDLSGDDPVRPLAEIDRFQGRVLKGAAHPEGRYFLAEGKLRADDLQAEEIVAFDGTTGKPIWTHVPTEPEVWPTLDPLGSVLSYTLGGEKSIVLVDIPSEDIQRLPLSGIQAVSPHGEEWLMRHLGRRGLIWWRRGADRHLAALGSDFNAHLSSPRFSRDGRMAVFGTSEGLIVVCDLPEIERRLAEFERTHGGHTDGVRAGTRQ
jgi:eukaryotic-like serine/threonine-protein kinase